MKDRWLQLGAIATFLIGVVVFCAIKFSESDDPDPIKPPGSKPEASQDRGKQTQVDPDYAELSALISTDPEAASEWLSGPRRGEHSMIDLGKMLIENEADHGSELFEIFKHVRPRFRADYLIGELFEVLDKKHFQAGLDLLCEIEPGSFRRSGMSNFLARLDPDEYFAAYQKFSQDGHPKDLETLERNVSFNLKKFDRDQLDQLASLKLSEDLDAEIAALRGHLLVKDYSRDEALEKALAMDGPHKSWTVRSVIRTGRDAEGGREWLLEVLEDLDPQLDFDRAALVAGAAESLGHQESIQAAIDWSLKVENQEWRQRAFADVFRSWIRLDSIESSEWITNAPQGQIRDIATINLVRHLLKTGDHDLAREWNEQIADEKIRAKGESLLPAPSP